MTEAQPRQAERPRELQLEITDLKTGYCKVDVRLPVNLAAVALRSGARLLPPMHDDQALAAALEHGTTLELRIKDVINDEQVVISIK